MARGKVGITKKGLVQCYEGSPEAVKGYFNILPQLLEIDYEYRDYSTCLAYLFFKTEYAHTLALYYRLLQMKVNKNLADKAVNNTIINREGFRSFFEKVFGEPLSENARKKIKDAEEIRDKIMHGKDDFSSSEVRVAIKDILEYAGLFNKQVERKVGYKPFSTEQKTRSRDSYSKEISAWILTGMGFSLKKSVKQKK